MKKQNVKSKQTRILKGSKGITLIALVITIIVLLILAAVSIATLTGDNGILTKAQTAKERTEEEQLKEMVRTDILGYQAENKNGDITAEQLRKVLDKYFKGVPGKVEELEENLKDENYSLKARDEYGENLNLKVSDLYKGDLTTGTVDDDPRPDAGETSYVGYYADFQNDNGDQTPDGKPDGIIYADLAVGGEGQWNENKDSNYEYDAVKEGLKSYKIGEQKNVEGFNNYTKEVISPANGTSGLDRFYVMALEDLDEKGYYWYYNAYNLKSLDNPEDSKKINFNESNGKENTDYMINAETGKWRSEEERRIWKNRC